MNILFCSVGRRCELLKDFRNTLGDKVKIVVTDNSYYAPAVAFADVSYKVPLITDKDYIPMILDICKKEKIDAVTTLIDPEIAILAEHRDEFKELGVEVLAPYLETAKLCFPDMTASGRFTELIASGKAMSACRTPITRRSRSSP